MDRPAGRWTRFHPWQAAHFNVLLLFSRVHRTSYVVFSFIYRHVVRFTCRVQYAICDENNKLDGCASLAHLMSSLTECWTPLPTGGDQPGQNNCFSSLKIYIFASRTTSKARFMPFFLFFVFYLLFLDEYFIRICLCNAAGTLHKVPKELTGNQSDRLCR